MYTYVLFTLPHGFNFKQLTNDQAKENLRVFIRRIPERLRILEEVVRLELPGWRADLSEESLGPLGEWFALHVEERQMTEKERADLREKMGPHLGALADIHTEFTPETLSFGIDVGIYLGECVRMRCPGTAWKLGRRSKQPALAGFVKNDDYHPIVIASLAHPIVRARRKAALAGLPTKEPFTLAEKLAAVQLSIPDKNPKTMLHELFTRCLKIAD